MQVGRNRCLEEVLEMFVSNDAKSILHFGAMIGVIGVTLGRLQVFWQVP